MNSQTNVLQKYWPAFFLVGVTVVFFWQIFLLDQTMYVGDTSFVLLPFRHYATARLAAGELPLWNPYLFGGTPALAEAQYQVFYLPNLLLFVLGVARGASWSLAFHVLWAAGGTYLFARRCLEVGRMPALVAALVFAFGARMQAISGAAVWVQAASWLPWILLAYSFACKKGGAALLLPGLALTLQFLTGASQYLFYSLSLLAAYHFVFLPRDKSARRQSFQVLGISIGLLVVLSAAQWLPQWELAGQSNRGTRASYEYATQASLSPRQFLTTLFAPGYYGLFDEAPREGFAAGEATSYPGLVALVLIGVAFVTSCFKLPLRGRVFFWLICGVLALTLSFGGYNPLYPFLYQWIPGIALFRAPARWLLVTTFAGAMLAALGLHQVLQWKRFAASTQLAQALCGVVLTFLVIDFLLLSHHMPQQQTLSVAAVESPSKTSLFLKGQSGFPRFWTLDAAIPTEQWQAPEAILNASRQEFRGVSARTLRELMPSCLPAEFQAAGLTGAWGALMPLRRHAHPIYDPATSKNIQQKWLRLLGVRYYLSLEQPSDPALQIVNGESPFVSRDALALPRAFWVGKTRIADGQTAMPLVASSEFDPRLEVIVETTSPLPTGDGWKEARVLIYEPHRVLIEVNAPRKGLVVMMDTIYPGWKAEVDGTPSVILPANWMGRATRVGAGKHRVRYHFEPQSVRLGLFVSLLGLMGMAFVLAASPRKRTGAKLLR